MFCKSLGKITWNLALSRYMSNPNITLTLTSNRVIVIYSNTFRLLIYRESALNSQAITMKSLSTRVGTALTQTHT